MTKRQTYPDPTRKRRYILIGVCVVVIVLLAALIWRLSAEERAVTFPYFVEGDKVEVTSLFQYTGMNPDCVDEMGENIAALAVTNHSGKHLDYLELKLKLKTGETLVFETADVPNAQTVWMFEKDNTGCSADAVVCDVDSTARLGGNRSLLGSQVVAGVNETAVTLTNVSGEDLEDLKVYCHTLFEQAYFGGLVYCYEVGGLPAGESLTFEAEDCYLGEAAVVRVTEGE